MYMYIWESVDTDVCVNGSTSGLAYPHHCCGLANKSVTTSLPALEGGQAVHGVEMIAVFSETLNPLRLGRVWLGLIPS